MLLHVTEVVNLCVALYGPSPTEVRAATLTKYTVLERREENVACVLAVLRRVGAPPPG